MVSIFHLFRKITIVFMLALYLVQGIQVYAIMPQESRVNQRKINAERAKKAKNAKKQYDKAVKQHYDNQSKETKAMMKKAKREAKKNTPIK